MELCRRIRRSKTPVQRAGGAHPDCGDPLLLYSIGYAPASQAPADANRAYCRLQMPARAYGVKQIFLWERMGSGKPDRASAEFVTGTMPSGVLPSIWHYNLL